MREGNCIEDITSHPSLGQRGSHPQPPPSLCSRRALHSLPAFPSPALMEVSSRHLKIIKRRLKFLLCPITVGFHAGKQGDLFRDRNISSRKDPRSEKAERPLRNDRQRCAALSLRNIFPAIFLSSQLTIKQISRHCFLWCSIN